MMFHSCLTIRQCLLASVSRRSYCYKTVRRPNLAGLQDKPNRQHVEKKLQEHTGDLSKHIRAKIALGGPITVAEYMKEVLINPSSGYYMSKDVFGQQGDFITSPEINQIFGEMIAIWCMTEWQKLGSPLPLQIVELGPGRGTLMQDILRVFGKFNLAQELSIHFVEISSFMSNLQGQRLCMRHKEVNDATHYRAGQTVSGISVFWHRSVDDIPDGFKIVLAHEFFDALPIHKLLKDGNRWLEMLVDSTDNGFRFVKSREETPVSKIYSKIAHPDESREVVEVCLEAEAILKALSKKVEENGGFGLIMDYGHFGEKGDTFRAFKNHALHDPLVDPGFADLTADVDFRFIKKSCEEDDRLITFGPIEQGEFIKRMGGDVRLEVLLEQSKDDETRKTLKAGYEMLTLPDKMGKRFKFFSFFPSVTKNHLDKFPVTGFHK